MVLRNFLLALAAAGAVSCADLQTFLSRPGEVSPTLNIQFSDPKKLAPGYIFISPYNGTSSGTSGSFGALIYDNEGNLVWNGRYLQEVRSMDTHICTYHGQKGTHICFTDALPAKQGPGHSQGKDRFLDNTYTEVGYDHGAVNGFNEPDIHELNTPIATNGRTFIQDVYQVVPRNLTIYDGPEQGFILSGCFQELELKSRSKDTDVLFQWCSGEHVPLYESYSYIHGNTAGNASDGYSRGTNRLPWDYFHINAIDKDTEGDYYISSRATHTIYKVGGNNYKKPGDIIWRLGGRYSDFTFKGNLNFSQQHDVRVESMKGDITVLSLFDNHIPNIGNLPAAQASSGKFMKLNTKEMTAEKTEEYVQPESLFSLTGGETQKLDNGNVFIGWGAQPSVSEYVEGIDGKAIFYATFAQGLKSYRSYKFPWVGNPALPPDVFAYQHHCKAEKLVVYASWNGATEYTGFQVFGTNTNSTDNGTQLGKTFKRTGYETVAKVKASPFYQYVYVQALGAGDKVLGTSNPAEVFVPKKALAASCNINSCPDGTDYSEANSAAENCSK